MVPTKFFLILACVLFAKIKLATYIEQFRYRTLQLIISLMSTKTIISAKPSNLVNRAGMKV